VLIDPSGLTLTNHHVVAAAGPEGWGGLSDGKLYRWKLIGTDPGGDIAMIQLQRKEPFPVARIGDSDALRVGDWALVMGNPFALADNYQPTVTMGVVSGVKRYQPGGGGKNQLIYGNCIQVDASINPGNSGGPLFNMQSQLVGINGRGSFQERGRVNVGLGYAVSMRQILNFIPDLLATKIAMHGTLDALFTNRGGRVVCSTIDLDSAAAQAGLALGDEIVSFDGEPITDANEFTNLVTTLPAGWPVRLVCRRGDREYSLTVPLSPLPYSLKQPNEKEDEEPPPQAPKPTSWRGTPGAAVDSHTEDPPGPLRPMPPRGLGWKLEQAGQINDRALSEANAQRILSRLRAEATSRPAAVPWLKTTETITRNQRPVGTLQCLYGDAGKFRIDATLDHKSQVFGFDGKEFWLASPGKGAEVLDFAKWVEDPLRMQAFAVVASGNPDLLSARGTVTIDGGDRVARQRAYRLQLAVGKNPLLTFWVSLDWNGDLTRHQLLAVAGAPVGGAIDKQVVFYNFQPVFRYAHPYRREIVGGAQRNSELVITTTDREGTTKIPDDAFQKPNHVPK
jgi:S1-C subfamily serine protease